MKKKTVIPLLAAGAALLAACGSGGSTNASPPQSTASSPAASTASSSQASGGSSTGNPSSQVTLHESGSTLLYPYLQELVSPLNQAYSNIQLAPGPGGSGKGISDAIAGTTQIGGSDAYLAPKEVAAHPGLANIPIAVSAQAVNYNLPGLSGNLRLSGNVLAQIYEGKITKWNDSQIAGLNPGVSLPSTKIVPVRRIDSSGDTFIFTSLLTATNSAWSNGPNFGTTVTWPPVQGELTANGNPGMVQTCHATVGCIAYIGVSSEAPAKAAGLGEALLQDKNGDFVLPTQTTIGNAVKNSTGSVPANLAASLIYSPGSNSYPIVNFEYIIVKDQQPDSTTAKAIRTFLSWAVSPSGGAQSQYLSKEDFVALPSSVIPKVNAAIAKIT